MELFTRENIGNYTSDPYAKNDYKYSKEMQEIRKALQILGLLISARNNKKVCL